jgi:uncharacterized delta-60 repeat protein
MNNIYFKAKKEAYNLQNFITQRFVIVNDNNEVVSKINYPTLDATVISINNNDITLKTGFNAVVNCICLDSNGKILVGGTFTFHNGTTSNRIIRLNPDGSRDTSFNIGTGFNNAISSICLDSDNKILLAGNFTSYNGITLNRIIRLNPDGSVDSTFNIGSGFNTQINSICLDSDGKILVAGAFNSYNFFTINRIIRLNPDGSRDTSFNIGTGFNGNVTSMCLDSDDKILVAGNFTSYNGITSNRIIRLNPDASVDSTFNIGSGFSGSVNCIHLYDGDKILVGTNFSNYNNTSINYLTRLNPDGSVDNTFNIGIGFSDPVTSLKVDSDGKILVGGMFLSFNSVIVNKITRLFTDGSRDNTFDITLTDPLVPSFRVRAIEHDTSGRILIGGEFTGINI